LNLVAGDAAGAVRFINVRNRMKSYPLQYVKGIRYISEKNNIILLATTNGLITFSASYGEPESIRFIRNTRRPDDVNSLSGNDVMFIFTDRRGDTYLITQNAGINRIESPNLLSDHIVFKVFNERNGLASDLTRSMAEDRFGKLWLISKHMITRFDSRQGLIDNYGSHIFRESFIFSEAAVLKDALGNIVIGTSSGLFRYDPAKMVKKNITPPIIFTGLKVQGTELDQDADLLDKLVLKASQRNLIIQFAALDYVGSDQVKYSYKLEGVDEAWHEETTNRSAVYLSLPHGKLKFIVRSTNSEGAWVKNDRSLLIVVRPTFWETPWFWLLFLLLIVGIVLTVVRVLFTIYRLRHEVDMEQHLSDIKLKFFTDVSHELRTPLTLIASPINEVIEKEDLSDKARQHLILVQRNVARLLTLVNQILDFRKIQNKRMTMLVEETEIISQLRRIMENFSLISKEKDINFQLETSTDSLTLWVDKDKFEKIIFNLLSNAFKYSQDGKTVRIRVMDESEKVRISVFDQGIGIPSNKLNSIFKRFEMFAGPEWSQQSSGIGLSLVKELTELHHGSIEAFSKQNEGSEFRLILLKGRAHYQGDEQTEFILGDGESDHDNDATSTELVVDDVEFTAEERKAGQTILVVEDNLELLQFLKEIFTGDFRVLTALNGQEGLEKTLDVLPDLIVCDVMMPVMDGLEMIRLIKDNKDICHIPIIILSAKDTLEDRILGLERGIDDYITKPFSASYLRMRVKTLLSQRKSLQEAMLAAMELSTSDDAGQPLRIMPSDPKITNHDEYFIGQILDFMERNMDNTSLTVDEIALYLSMSRTVFYKKVKSLFGVTPIDLVKDIRVKRSVQLIQSGMYSFSEIAYMSGFSDPNYFGKCFKKLMGVTPSKFKESLDQS
jgi:signal transduction histidine kinase/DNA-binding response OmpR family regulator